MLLNGWVGIIYFIAKLKNIKGIHYTKISLIQLVMEISHKQTSLFTEVDLMFLQEDSLARTQAMPNKMVKVNKGFEAKEQDCYGIWSEQSTKADLSPWWPKTLRTFLKLTEGKTLEQYSLNWPEWGTMQNGEFAERQMSVPPITVPGCISLLTPTASECNRDRVSFPMYTKRHHRSPGGLSEQLYRLVGGGKWACEPPVLCVANGLSAKLVRQSLHGYGNAVVPDIPFEIFKVIEQMKKQNK